MGSTADGGSGTRCVSGTKDEAEVCRSAHARELLCQAGRTDLVLVENGLATADMGSTTRATNVACISLTASSMEMPQPSLRISTPKILAAHMAPYSLAPESVMSKGNT